ncbi:hypothetical protein LTR08_005575 [Meristemomyces frigidus]|nr:hypothetical protein LTR08_005575 [Meristemomyces frigidus]
MEPASNLQGARSLQDMATIRILRNIEGLRGDDLVAVLGPNPLLVDRLWRSIERENLDSLPVWQAFAHVQGVDIGQVRYWDYDCRRCSFSRLPRLLELADNPTFAWLSNLTLGFSDRGLRSQDFLHVPKLQNVRNIRVFGSKQHGEGFTDRVFRAWADAAKKEGAFSRLRTILLEGRTGGQKNVTHWSLGNLWCFPALEIFGLAGFGIQDMYTAKCIGCFEPKRKCANYVQMRLSSPVDGLILEVTIGGLSPDIFSRKAATVWFERDWTPWVSTAGEIVPWDYELSRPVDHPVKRRKLKVGKTQQLADVMNSMI